MARRPPRRTGRADDTREIHDEYELDRLDVEDSTAFADDQPTERIEPDPADIRETATPDPIATMHPAPRRRVAQVDETTQAVANAQAALGEIAQRQLADAERAAREADENTRRIDLTRWHEEADTTDRGTEAVADAGVADEPILER